LCLNYEVSISQLLFISFNAVYSSLFVKGQAEVMYGKREPVE